MKGIVRYNIFYNPAKINRLSLNLNFRLPDFRYIPYCDCTGAELHCVAQQVLHGPGGHHPQAGPHLPQHCRSPQVVLSLTHKNTTRVKVLN